MAASRLPAWVMAVLLVLVTIALYWPAMGFDFVNYDDPNFVASNAHVQGSLNWEAVKWAFQLNEGDYWHPLTWLSLMLDASLFGQAAGGFHFTNVAFHAANSVIAFPVAEDINGGVMAECGGGGAVCTASAARGVGGLGDGTQGCPQRLLRPARADILRPLCPRQNAEAGDRKSEGRRPESRDTSPVSPFPVSPFHASRFISFPFSSSPAA